MGSLAVEESTWELEKEMRRSHPNMFFRFGFGLWYLPCALVALCVGVVVFVVYCAQFYGKIRRTKFFKRGEVVKF